MMHPIAPFTYAQSLAIIAMAAAINVWLWTAAVRQLLRNRRMRRNHERLTKIIRQGDNRNI